VQLPQFKSLRVDAVLPDWFHKSAGRLAKTPLRLTNGVTISRESVLSRNSLAQTCRPSLTTCLCPRALELLPRTWMLTSLSMKSVLQTVNKEAGCWGDLACPLPQDENGFNVVSHSLALRSFELHPSIHPQSRGSRAVASETAVSVGSYVTPMMLHLRLRAAVPFRSFVSCGVAFVSPKSSCLAGRKPNVLKCRLGHYPHRPFAGQSVAASRPTSPSQGC